MATKSKSPLATYGTKKKRKSPLKSGPPRRGSVKPKAKAKVVAKKAPAKKAVAKKVTPAKKTVAKKKGGLMSTIKAGLKKGAARKKARRGGLTEAQYHLKKRDDR